MTSDHSQDAPFPSPRGQRVLPSKDNPILSVSWTRTGPLELSVTISDLAGGDRPIQRSVTATVGYGLPVEVDVSAFWDSQDVVGVEPTHERRTATFELLRMDTDELRLRGVLPLGYSDFFAGDIGPAGWWPWEDGPQAPEEAPATPAAVSAPDAPDAAQGDSLVAEPPGPDAPWHRPDDAGHGAAGGSSKA